VVNDIPPEHGLKVLESFVDVCDNLWDIVLVIGRSSIHCPFWVREVALDWVAVGIVGGGNIFGDILRWFLDQNNVC